MASKRPYSISRRPYIFRRDSIFSDQGRIFSGPNILPYNRKIVTENFPKKILLENIVKPKKTLSTDDLAPHVERILTAVVNWKPETRNPFRLKVRRLLERLVKKFGFDIIQKFVPEKSPIAKAGFRIHVF